ncbi:MAG: FumA C-terminus/TtdB family hydratase beta subunit [Methanomassiliicoccales archaeon]
MRTPIPKEEVRSLGIGDIVHLDGTLFTGRDEMHIRALERAREGKELPVDLENAVVFHCGPLVVRHGEEWRVVAAGPTTSARMNSLEPDFIREFGVSAIIGKGGMSSATVEAMREHGCVYLAMTGGAAALAARNIKGVVSLHWEDLGVPEAIWELEVESFGPLTVAIDAHGNSLYEEVGRNVAGRLQAIRKGLGITPPR